MNVISNKKRGLQYIVLTFKKKKKPPERKTCKKIIKLSLSFYKNFTSFSLEISKHRKLFVWTTVVYVLIRPPQNLNLLV
jgi:hypothetical protein